LAHGGDGVADIGEIHRAAVIDDGAQPLAVLAALSRGIDQPPHHGGSGEHHDIVELAAEIEHRVGLEAAAFGHDVAPAHARDREIVEAGASPRARAVAASHSAMFIAAPASQFCSGSGNKCSSSCPGLSRA